MESREIRLKARPAGLPGPEHFELATVTVPPPGPGEVRVRNRFLSVDPYMRGRMIDRPSYVPPFSLGAPLEGGALGEVVDSGDPAFRPGDLVLSMLGWREAFTAPASALRRVEPIPGIPEQAFLGVLGMPGLTAWGGLLQIGQPRPGETVFVSGAAGAVGSAVAQIARNLGCTVVASAGSEAKCAWLRTVGIPHVINYRTCGNLLEAVRAAAPQGIDVYFDNVGGEHLEVALACARPFGRLVECGMISQYNAEVPPPGPRNLVLVIAKSLRMQGFIVTQFGPLEAEFRAQMAAWIREGRLQWQETVVEGIANAPEAFIGLFRGDNLGKMLVRT
ncbi:MAG: NADP-dependent oxidoreductase [Sphingomonadaceae bacterium]|uniref:NADP-dependent oxidoreductase n=1 Tax=Thermaurantiacus sp. TaxID=2820283 RepID=UPI00298F13C2|nr:NADP-dependent oxidoreductase [Thermaurantiacus sp.]MCS6986600.1 NADP-dependent oxidoreductase [Sphingomonadaceae bacterium]MDW8414139.1 NADP-dependent oxidoreductase [Thermaurantiacus sp.]